MVDAGVAIGHHSAGVEVEVDDTEARKSRRSSKARGEANGGAAAPYRTGDPSHGG